MENNKIIIKVPEELKKDLSNTKALDWQENESFFSECGFERWKYIKMIFWLIQSTLFWTCMKNLQEFLTL